MIRRVQISFSPLQDFSELLAYSSPGVRSNTAKLCKHIWASTSSCSNTSHYLVDTGFYIRRLGEWCPAVVSWEEMRLSELQEFITEENPVAFHCNFLNRLYWGLFWTWFLLISTCKIFLKICIFSPKHVGEEDLVSVAILTLFLLQSQPNSHLSIPPYSPHDTHPVF